MDMMQVKPVKANTYANLGALKDKLSKFGLKYLDGDDNGKWMAFCSSIFEGEGNLADTHVILHYSCFSYKLDISDKKIARNLTAINEAIMDFYKAEGILSDEGATNKP